jgi:ribosomal protein S18 acetylase RimI-like enzyme
MTSPADVALPRDAVSRMRQFLRHSAELTAESLTGLDGVGLALRCPSLPAAWYLNQIRVLAPANFEQVLALADEHLGDLPYRCVFVEHEPTGERLEPSFREAGWEVVRESLMVLAAPAPAPAPPPAAVVIEPGVQEVADLMGRWHAEDEPQASAEEIAQIVGYSCREGEAWGERRFGVRDEQGALVAITKLRSDGSAAQVEDVYVVPEARRRGYATALVRHAVAEAAAHDLIFIVADEDAPARRLYERLGFRAGARAWAFHRGALA